MQSYIQHLISERIPMAANIHNQHLEAGDDVDESEEYKPKNDLSTVVGLIHKLRWSQYEDFIF